MIIEKKALSMAEVSGHLGNENAEVLGFIRKFTEIKSKDAEEMRQELEGLEMAKMNEEHIVKTIDFLPENQEELNKIFSDVSLEENEANSILDIVKKYK